MQVLDSSLYIISALLNESSTVSVYDTHVVILDRGSMLMNEDLARFEGFDTM